MLRVSADIPWAEFLSSVCSNGDYYPRDTPGRLCTYFNSTNIDKIRGAWEKTALLMKAGAAPQDIGLYIHWPFCPKECVFCSSSVFKDPGHEDMLDILKSILCEIDSLADIFKGITFSSLWIGGGTPTCMPDEMFETLLSHVFRNFSFSSTAQIYTESSLETLSKSKLLILKRYGFNRSTIIVQNGGANREVDKAGSWRDVEDIFTKLNSLPGFIPDIALIISERQTISSLLEDIKAILELRPSCIHFYNFNDRHQTQSSVENKIPEGAKGAVALALLERLDRIFLKSGYRIQRDDLENPRLYPWEEKQGGSVRKFRASVVGIGPNVVSHAFGSAWYTHSLDGILDNFSDSLPPFFWIRSDVEEEMRGYASWYLSRSLRIPREAFRKLFGCDIMKTFLAEIFESWRNEGWLEIQENAVILKIADCISREVLLKRLYSRKIVSAILSSREEEFKQFCRSFRQDPSSWRNDMRIKNEHPGFRVYYDAKFWGGRHANSV